MCVCDVETSTMRQPGPDLGCSSQKEAIVLGILHEDCFAEFLILFANLNKCVSLRHFLHCNHSSRWVCLTVLVWCGKYMYQLLQR